MDVERTMEFILELHARTEAELAKLAVTQNRLSRDVVRLSRLGVKSRTKINRRLDNHEQWAAEFNAGMDKVKETLGEVGEKLNGLIHYVDRLPRNPTQS